MDIRIDGNTVGVALLVSNDYKTVREVSDLPFTHTDTKNMEQVLEEFTYAVYRIKNVSTNEFVSSYKNLADHKYPATCKRILLYFAGHGDDGNLWMQDGGKVNIDDVISRFKIHVAGNESLATMVKMFFFDACRGTQKDGGYSVRTAKPVDEITCLRRIPKEGNMLIAYASTRYYVAHESSSGGRWTNCLVKALRDSEESDDVLHILTEANIMMNEEPNHRYFQTAEFISSLVDHVYFKKEAIKMRNIPTATFPDTEYEWKDVVAYMDAIIDKLENGGDMSPEEVIEYNKVLHWSINERFNGMHVMSQIDQSLQICPNDYKKPKKVGGRCPIS